MEFIARQREPRIDANVVRLSDGESGLSAQTIKRRLSSVSGLYAYLMMVGEHDRNPVPNGLSVRRRGRRGRGGVTPLVRGAPTLPQILDPAEGGAPFWGPPRPRGGAWSRASFLAGRAAAGEPGPPSPVSP